MALHENPEWLSVALGIGGIITSASVGVLVYTLDKKRRKREEEHYKQLVIENLKSIKDVFMKVLIVTNPDDGSPESTEELTQKLDNYFEGRYRYIRNLITETRSYMKEWRSLDTTTKNNIAYILDSLEWLIETFYPEGKKLSVKERRWQSKKDELIQKKDKIIGIINSVQQN